MLVFFSGLFRSNVCPCRACAASFLTRSILYESWKRIGIVSRKLTFGGRGYWGTL
ncbi:hypothetical protein CSUI_002282 [Cystoisospora suis]|uniref:Uncharacterized protein n=1 Tax=Cystoisospora suis TaxID=483139 RepID=A0A2C6KUI7_9APIC|nr:hypothetical protein CSUI_002282 [Cystoisospora suis]